MKGLFRIILFLSVILSAAISAKAQDLLADSSYIASVQDTLDRYIREHPHIFGPRENRIKLSPMMAFSYSKEYKFGVTVGLDAKYRNGFRTDTPFSTVSVLAEVTTNKSFYFGLSGMNYSESGNYLIDYSLKLYNSPRYFWGLGYLNARENDNESTFKERGLNLRIDFLRKFSHFTMGAFLGFDYYNSTNFSRPELIEGYPLFSRAFKVGIRVEYDSRDNILAPQSGIFAKTEYACHPRMVDGEQCYHKSRFIFDYFTPLWNGGVLAFDCYCEFNYGDSPWFEWYRMGGDARMRGYYRGRFRDRNFISSQVELRQTIYNIHGAVAWAGVGNIYHKASDFKIKQTLPTFGAGYRLTLGETLFRLDLGFGKAGYIALFAGVNHAF